MRIVSLIATATLPFALSACASAGSSQDVAAVVQDERVTQNELNIIAMRKTIKFKVNYYQQRMRNVARRLITSAIPSIYPEK